ncbi:MAG TPA: glycoside hydrolase family 3 C-terminal domain-containing protein [Terracidiphilus sp.]|nr:glycoside hydrolase family 3 C-terminal domain-containing protein [Terracidiphilus sp.]
MKTPLERTLQSIAFILVACFAPLGLRAQAPAPDSPAIETRAHALLDKLTLQQKIELLGGVDSMFTRAMPFIDLPRFKMSDASVGVRTWGPTTAFAGGVALAATWDPAFARTLGESLGRDARARGVNFLLGPGVNIARAPVGGRNFEYLSEDPYLNAALDVPYIEGVQSEGVAATVKHYALNDEEYNRHNASSDADERTMREIYLPAFEAAVTRAHVAAVMNSYNLLNGVHATQNPFLNLEVLKGDWAFKGVLMSDWDATYNGVEAANNGLDLEMPSPKFMNAANLLPAVKDGQVKESTIDDKVLRLLRVELEFGWTDRPQFDPRVSTYSVADRAVALQGALESITLLKNEGHLLPLDAAKIKTIAIVGPNAWPAVTGGGGSSYATPFAPVGILTGIANYLGPDVHVLYSRGLPEMEDLFRDTNWQDGLKAESSAGPSVHYTASYTAEKSGPYLLLSSLRHGGAYSVSVDGKRVINEPGTEGDVPQSATLELTAGQTVQVEAVLARQPGGAGLQLGMAWEPDLVSADARKIASLADVVVVAAGFDAETEGEGHDRTFKLPWGQDALIQAMAAANPHTIVTLTGGGGMETQSWLDKVPVLLHLWYPGQEGGTALAEILFGKHDPEGRLPVTFDRSWPDSASYKWYYPQGPDTTLNETGADGKPVEYQIAHVVYGDKLMVGYRYWTTVGKQPLFPFGFGLSYTTFRFSALTVPATAKAGATVPVSFDVTNTGKLAGAELAELYVSDPSATVERPERALKGFEKVRLEPGQTKRVTLDLDARAFSYWDVATRGWKIDPGRFVIRVGGSSEDTPLDANLTLQ